MTDHILAPETKPKETANKIYPVAELTAERQNTLILMPHAHMTLRLITPILGHRSGTNVRETAEVPFKMEIYVTGIRRTKTLFRKESHIIEGGSSINPAQCCTQLDEEPWKEHSKI